MNSSSMVVFNDFIKRLRKSPPRVPEILTLRLWTIAIGVFGTATAAALYLSLGAGRSQTVLDVWWKYAGAAGGGMFGLFVLAWIMPRVPTAFAAAGVMTSIPVMAWGLLMRGLDADSPWKAYECPLHSYLVGVLGMLTVLGVAAVGMLAVRGGWVEENKRMADGNGE
jgi:hypothetical protein